LAHLNASMQGGVGVSGRGAGLRSLPLRARAASGRRATASFALRRKNSANHEQANKMLAPSTVVVDKEAGEAGKPKAMPESVKKVLVAAAAGVLLTSTAMPEESWAARSGGRVGGRAFRSAPRAAPRASPRMRSGGSGGVYTAPPLVGGYGGGYGYGRGYGFPVFAPPIFFFSPFGSIFQLFLLFVAVQTVLGFVQNFRTEAGFKDREEDDEDIFD